MKKIINNKEAKKIYIASLGNKYFMALNGDLNKYESFKISKFEENIWSKDLINKYFHEISKTSRTNFEYINLHSDLCSLVFKNQTYQKKIFKLTKDKIKKVDSYTKLRLIINIIDNILHDKIISNKEMNKLEEAMKQNIIIELQSIMISPITMDDSYVNNIEPENLTSEFIREYAKNKLLFLESHTK